MAPTHEHERLRSSLLLLGAVLTIALIGLAVDGNWPKVLRVGAAGCTYAAIVLGLTHRRTSMGGSVGWWRFALAGLAAGAASGLLRPEPSGFIIATDAAAATVVAAVHWLGLAQSERLRRKLAA